MTSNKQTLNYMSVPQMLAYLDISRHMLNLLIQDGMPCIKIGKRTYFNQSKVDEYLESKGML